MVYKSVDHGVIIAHYNNKISDTFEPTHEHARQI